MGCFPKTESHPPFSNKKTPKRLKSSIRLRAWETAEPTPKTDWREKKTKEQKRLSDSLPLNFHRRECDLLVGNLHSRDMAQSMA